MRSARPTVPSPTARRSSTTGSRASPTSIRRSSAPCARPRRMPRATGSSSSSTAAGVPRRTRSSSSARRSRSTARRRKPPAGWPPPTRRLTCRATRSTSGPPPPRRGCPSTAPRTGCARSTATSPGTTSCARRPIDHGCPADVRRPDARSKDAAVTEQNPAAGRPRRGRPDRAGCGSNAPSETAPAPPRTKKTTARDKAVKFAECMREQRRPASSRTRTRRAS